jgi:hypothetical protein
VVEVALLDDLVAHLGDPVGRHVVAAAGERHERGRDGEGHDGAAGRCLAGEHPKSCMKRL